MSAPQAGRLTPIPTSPDDILLLHHPQAGATVRDNAATATGTATAATRDNAANAATTRGWDSRPPAATTGATATGSHTHASSARLDPADPIDAVLLEIHELNRRKRADYAIDGAGPFSPFSNFYGMAARLRLPGFDTALAIESHIASKEERLVALRTNGRPPQNESVLDTLLDRAVYACLAVAHARVAGRRDPHQQQQQHHP